jgi:hypothetical protein
MKYCDAKVSLLKYANPAQATKQDSLEHNRSQRYALILVEDMIRCLRQLF